MDQVWRCWQCVKTAVSCHQKCLCEQGIVDGEVSCLHDSLHEGLASFLLVLSLDLVHDAQLLKHVEQLLLVVSHASLNNGLDGIIHKLAETTLAAGAVSLLLGPLLGLGIKEVVAPQLLHHLDLVSAELLGIDLGKRCESEGPTVKTSTEGDCSLFWVNLQYGENAG